MTTYVYGASDDLIEIEGSLSEEFNYYRPFDREAQPYYLGFSDGTLLKINYDGDWNIKLIEGQASIWPAGTIPDEAIVNVPDYSDLAVIYSDVTWVIGGTDVIK